MDQTRLLLAVVAALLALLFLGVWWVRGRQHSEKKRGLVLVYALLLFASSAILLLRSAEPIGNETLSSSVTRNEPKRREPAADDLRREQMERAQLDTVSRDSEQPDIRTDDRATLREQPEREEQPATLQLPKARTRSLPSHGPPERSLPKAKRGLGKAEPEEVVESAVLTAFDLIELFFEEHAAPAPDLSAAPKDEAPRMIKFVPGTAELDAESRRYLETLAPALLAKYTAGHLEIRAQTDESVNSAALRYLLTQSRAEAVRDVLIAEGFPEDRLVPVGSEDAGKSKVSFVHRPN